MWKSTAIEPFIAPRWGRGGRGTRPCGTASHMALCVREPSGPFRTHGAVHLAQTPSHTHGAQSRAAGHTETCGRAKQHKDTRTTARLRLCGVSAGPRFTSARTRPTGACPAVTGVHLRQAGRWAGARGVGG